MEKIELEKEDMDIVVKAEKVYAIDVYSGEEVDASKPYQVCHNKHYNYVKTLEKNNRQCMEPTCEYYSHNYNSSDNGLSGTRLTLFDRIRMIFRHK